MKFLLLLLPSLLLAQQSGPVSTPQPSCILSFQLPQFGQTVAPFNSQNFDNRFVGCTDWTVTVMVPTTISALSLVVQTAPDNGSGAPGSWSTFTAATGSNPNTLTSGWTATFTTGTSAYFAWLRVQLTSKTGTGQVVGKLRSSITGAKGGGGICPGAGSAGDVQYTNGTNCVSAPDFLYSAANDQVLIPVGGVAPAFPGLAFNGFPTVGFYYNSANGGPGIDDSPLLITAQGSGINTFVYIDNDSFRCGESDQLFQRGVCEFFSFRSSNNARFFDITDTFVNWGDPAGGGAGNRVGVGRFSSDGASTNVIHSARTDGGAHITHEAMSFQSAGCVFASIANCLATNNGTSSYCTDCTVTSSIDNTCAGGGSGAAFDRINGAYKCRL